MKCKHKWILTQRIPEIGYYSQRAGGEKQWADFEFVCPECGESKHYNINVIGKQK